MYEGGGGRAGNGWDGHLPSDKMERAILNAMEGIEDEDGKTNGFLKTDDDEMTVFRQRRTNTGPKGVREDAKRHYAMEKLKAQADAVRQQEMLKRQANATVKPFGEDSDEDSDEEDEEFKRYRLERLKAMQKHAASSAATGAGDGTSPPLRGSWSRTRGSRRPSRDHPPVGLGPSHDEVEVLFESYLQEVVSSLSALEALRFSIDNTEKFVSFR